MRKLVRPALVVVPNEMAALRMTEDLGLLLDGRAREPAGAGHLFSQDGGVQPRPRHAAHRGAGRLRHGQGGGAGRLRRRDDEPPDAGGALSASTSSALDEGARNGAGGTDAAPDRGGLRARCSWSRAAVSARCAAAYSTSIPSAKRTRCAWNSSTTRSTPSAASTSWTQRSIVPAARPRSCTRHPRRCSTAARRLQGGADAQQAAQDGADGQGRATARRRSKRNST